MHAATTRRNIIPIHDRDGAGGIGVWMSPWGAFEGCSMRFVALTYVIPTCVGGYGKAKTARIQAAVKEG